MTLPQRHLSQTVQTAVSVQLSSHIYAAVPANTGEGSGVTGRSRTYSSSRVEFQREFACRWLGLCMLARDGQFETTCAVFNWRWIQIQIGKFGGGCCCGERRQAKPTPDDHDAHVPRPLMGGTFLYIPKVCYFLIGKPGLSTVQPCRVPLKQLVTLTHCHCLYNPATHIARPSIHIKIGNSGIWTIFLRFSMLHAHFSAHVHK